MIVLGEIGKEAYGKGGCVAQWQGHRLYVCKYANKCLRMSCTQATNDLRLDFDFTHFSFYAFVKTRKCRACEFAHSYAVLYYTVVQCSCFTALVHDSPFSLWHYYFK